MRSQHKSCEYMSLCTLELVSSFHNLNSRPKLAKVSLTTNSFNWVSSHRSRRRSNIHKIKTNNGFHQEKRQKKMDEMPSEQLPLEKTNVVQLNTLLKGKGLPVSGRKAELINRLKNPTSGPQPKPWHMNQSPAPFAIFFEQCGVQHPRCSIFQDGYTHRTSCSFSSDQSKQVSHHQCY